MVSRVSSSRSMPHSDKMATTICLTWKESQVNKTVPTVNSDQYGERIIENSRHRDGYFEFYILISRR